jgi:hypothetical protein
VRLGAAPRCIIVFSLLSPALAAQADDGRALLQAALELPELVSYPVYAPPEGVDGWKSALAPSDFKSHLSSALDISSWIAYARQQFHK